MNESHEMADANHNANATAQLPSFGRWIRRALKIACLCFFVLIGCGFVYEQICRRNIIRNLKPTGQLIDVGGHRLHLVASGQGQPVVVLEAGLGASSADWSHIHAEVAKFTRVCSYDRAGLMWSDRGPGPRTSRQISKELRSLLDNAGESGPYVLVGQSLGGPHIRCFADKHPTDVAAMVLIDSSHHDQESRLPPEFRLDPPGWQLAGFRFLAEVGVFRLFDVTNSHPTLTDAAAAESRARFPTEVATIIDEINGISDSLKEAKECGDVGDVPLTVVSRGKIIVSNELSLEEATEAAKTWQQLQADLANLSPRGQLVIARNSGHSIHLDEPQVVVQAIQRIVQTVRAQQ